MVSLEKELKTSLLERISNMEALLLDLAKVRDAISAGLKETRRELERVHRRLGKSNPDLDKAKQSVIAIATQLGEARNTYDDMRNQLEDVLHAPPTSIELVNQALQNLIRASSTWEGIAQGIEDGFANAVDCSLPTEIKELESEVMDNGYPVLLAGEDRNEDNVGMFSDTLTKLMRPESEVA